MSRREAWAWGAAWVLLYALSAGAFWQDEYAYATGAGRVGAFLGRLVGSLLIALLLRWVWVRFLRPRPSRPLRTPWWVGVACVVALAYYVVAEARDPDPDERAACQLAARGAQDLTRSLGGGMQATSPPGSIASELEAEFADEASIRGFSVRMVSRRRGEEPIGFVVVAETWEQVKEKEDVLAPLNQVSTATVEAAEVGGRRGYLVNEADGQAIAAAQTEPCAVVLVLGADEPTTRRIAGALDVR